MKCIIFLILLIVVRAETQQDSVSQMIASHFFFFLGIIIGIIEIIFYIASLRGDTTVDFAIFTEPQQPQSNTTSNHPA